MRRVKIIFRVLVFLVFGLLFHYVLPQHDMVKVTSTEVIRTDFSSFNRLFYAQTDAGGEEQPTRDLRLINTQKQQTMLLGFVQRDASKVMVYRNEDTGWIWPPYFKFDSSDLQAEAANLAKGDEWVVITHYGWRIRWLSIYPNAIGARVVSGPDVVVLPWVSFIFFALLAAGASCLCARCGASSASVRLIRCSTVQVSSWTRCKPAWLSAAGACRAGWGLGARRTLLSGRLRRLDFWLGGFAPGLLGLPQDIFGQKKLGIILRRGSRCF